MGNQISQLSLDSVLEGMDDGWFGKPPVDEPVERVTRTYTTWFLGMVSTQEDRKARLSKVRNMVAGDLEEMHMAPSHTHPHSARVRATGTKFITKVCKVLGNRRYDISVSPREERLGASGERQFRTTKDLLVPPKVGELRRKDIVTFVDNCYYLTAEEISQYAGHDMAIFALMPEGLQGRTPNSVWAFETTDTVVELVDGGAEYRHRIWNWRRDAVWMQKGWFRSYLYDVTPHRIADDRYVVVLTLGITVNLPLWILRWLLSDVDDYKLQRMEVEKQGKYHLATFGTGEKQRIHVREATRLGNTSVVIKPDTFTALEISSRIPNSDKKVPQTQLLPAEAQRILKNLGEDECGPHSAHVLSEYFTHCYKPVQLINYQAKQGDLWETGKPTVSMEAVPLAGPGVGPCSSSNNEKRAVEKRILEIKNFTTFPSDMKKLAEEFVELMIPEAHKGVPWDMEELRAKQNRPAQITRRTQEQKFVSNSGGALRTRSFMKNEGYAKAGDPRLINQVPTDHTNNLCRFAGAFKEAMKTGPAKKWYFVGKTPTSIGSGLRGLFRRQGKLIGGDYSRMDGRTSVDYRRHVLRASYLRYFAPEYHEELIELLDKEEKAKTSTAQFGHKATLEGANISGSGITTDLNTEDAAFNEYTARRRRGESPQVAFSRLGAYFGDDSLTSESIFEDVRKVAASAGMVMTKEEEPEGAVAGRAVFLSRVYVDLETTSASHPVMERALRKLSIVSAGTSATKAHKLAMLANKAEGVLAADPRVPVLADYARAIQRVYKLDSVRVQNARRGLNDAKATAKAQRLARTGPYPLEDADIPLLEASIAQELKISVAELGLLRQRLNSAESEADLVACASILGADGPVLPDWAQWTPIDG